MTFSLVARSSGGELGVCIASSSIAVAGRCAFARPGVGSVVTQNVTDPRLGPRVLDLLEGGQPAPAALATAVNETEWSRYRQLAVVDSHGGVSRHMGSESLGTYACVEDTNMVAIGNLLRVSEVPAAMVDCFLREDPSAPLGARLLAALEGGLAAGGETTPVHSAGLLVVAALPWPSVDLRVDWSDQPIPDLRILWELWRRQAEDFVTRALDPSRAPTFEESSR